MGADASGGFGPVAGLRYGALGFALAFVALPLYVTLPAHYAQQYGVPLALLGAVLLLARALDALVDPWIGRRCDVWLNREPGRLLGWMAVAALLLGGGFLVMMVAATLAGTGGRVMPTWLITTYVLHSVGELCLSPVGLSSVTKLAPRRLVGQMMGIWFLATSLGNLMAGLMAGGDGASTPLPVRYLHIVLMAAAAGGLLVILARPINSLSQGVK